MSNVVPLPVAAERDRRRDAAAADHPMLRWVAGTAYWAAHRRNGEGDAACGADGTLILAPPGVPQCVECYPPAQRAGQQP